MCGNSKRVEGQRMSQRFWGLEYATVKLSIVIVQPVSGLGNDSKLISLEVREEREAEPDVGCWCWCSVGVGRVSGLQHSL